MDRNSIIHFVGFVTQLNQSLFVESWAHYAHKFSWKPGSVMLQEKQQGSGKYKYISQHIFAEEAFSFSFMKGRDTENFAGQAARVVMLGGYSRVETGYRHPGETRIFVFHEHRNFDMATYHDLPGKYSLNVYEPYYENCLLHRILEFITTEVYEPVLFTELLKLKESEEVSLYRECEIPASAY